MEVIFKITLPPPFYHQTAARVEPHVRLVSLWTPEVCLELVLGKGEAGAGEEDELAVPGEEVASRC